MCPKFGHRVQSSDICLPRTFYGYFFQIVSAFKWWFYFFRSMPLEGRYTLRDSGIPILRQGFRPLGMLRKLDLGVVNLVSIRSGSYWPPWSGSYWPPGSGSYWPPGSGFRISKTLTENKGKSYFFKKHKIAILGPYKKLTFSDDLLSISKRNYFQKIHEVFLCYFGSSLENRIKH